MKNLTKALVGTVAAGVMAVSTASPALARNNSDGIGAGEVIAGAIVIGGIAAIAAAASNSNDSYSFGRKNRYGDRYGYGRSGMNSRLAVEHCVAAAERGVNRYGYGRANVTRVTSINRKRDGFDVKGRIAVASRYGGWRGRGHDSGKFTCKVRYDRIAALDYSGIRGLR